MEVTATEARRRLGISPGELKRRMERGELKWRKKTASKFSDFLITLPDDNTAKVEKKVTEALKAPKPPKPEPEPEPVAEELEEEEEPESAPRKRLRELIKERMAARAAAKSEQKEKEEQPSEQKKDFGRGGSEEPTSGGRSDGAAKNSNWWF